MSNNNVLNLVENLTPASGTVDIDSLLNNMEDYVLKHTVLPEGAAVAVVLWCLSTYLINRFRIYPRLVVMSPEKRCGKSTLLDLIEAFSNKALLTSNVSTAVIYRTIDTAQPTLILDEADTFVVNSASDMTGIINSGHAKNRAYVMRCDGDSHTPTRYSTWTPMVLASIGVLQSTIMDRSIIVQLRRKTSSEAVCRLPADLVSLALTQRRELLKWSEDHAQIILSNPVEPPQIGNDRAVDNWLPLFTIAKQVSDSWFEKCQSAYSLLEKTLKEPELQTLLLQDIQTILSGYNGDTISSADLTKKLIEDKDKPWCELSNGRRISPHKLAAMLQPYDIRSDSYRIGSNVLRGYKKEQFTDAFDRYL